MSSGTFDSATFADWVAQGITTDDTVYITAPAASVATLAIQSVAIGAITLTTTPDDATDLTFIIKRSPANYDLPDNFNRLIGDLHYAANEFISGIVLVSIGALEEMRVHGDFGRALSNAPQFCAIRYKSSDGTTGQRQEILFWPEPDIYFPLTYSYEAYAGQLTDTLAYPLGGMHLSELYTESCLAVAEQRINNQPGVHTQAYEMLLQDAIARDKKRGARFFGQMGGGEDRDGRTFRRGIERAADGAHQVTYNGVVI